MTLSDTFVSPAKGKLLRTKIRYAYKPNTYSSITKNLLKTFRQSEKPAELPSLDLTSFPDFSKLPFPDNIDQAQKDKIIHDSIVAYAANMASDAAKRSSPKVSFRDIETQHAKDVKPIDDPIKDDVDSFLQGLFQFRRARAQLRGWSSATYLVAHEAADSSVDSSDDDDENNANKWTPTNIDLFKDFEKFDLRQMKGWAEAIWKSTDAELAATNGQSTVYTRKAFAEFIFGSIVPSLQKSIQNSIINPRLWNDGPYVWAVLVYRFFPTPVALKTTVLHKMKTLTLAEHNLDLKSYCAALIDMNSVVDTTANTDELVTAFLTQLNQHPSDIVRNHFNQIGLKFYMSPSKRPSITELLASADHLHNVTTSPSLPFAASSDKSAKMEQNIIALAGLMQSNYGSMKKIATHIGQLDNRLKQGFKASKNRNHGNRNGSHNNNTSPPWKHEAPGDSSEVRKFNDKDYYYCATCGRWTLSHSTNGFTHNGTTIPKHEGPTRNKRFHKPSTSADQSSKKQKSSSSAIDGLRSLKAEINKQSQSSLFDVIKAAAQEK